MAINESFNNNFSHMFSIHEKCKDTGFLILSLMQIQINYIIVLFFFEIELSFIYYLSNSCNNFRTTLNSSAIFYIDYSHTCLVWNQNLAWVRGFLHPIHHRRTWQLSGRHRRIITIARNIPNRCINTTFLKYLCTLQIYLHLDLKISPQILIWKNSCRLQNYIRLPNSKKKKIII